MKKNRNLFLSIIIYLSLLWFPVGCSDSSSSGGGGGNGGGSPLASITLSYASKMRLEATQQLTAIGTYDDDSTSDISSSVTWTSSDTACLTVDTAGLATSVGGGTSTITASNSGITSDSATITTRSLLVGLSKTDGKLYYVDESNGLQIPFLTITDSTADNETIDPARFRSLAYDSSTKTLYAGTGGDAACAPCIFTTDLSSGEASFFRDLRVDLNIGDYHGISGMDIGPDGDLYFIVGYNSNNGHKVFATELDASYDSREILDINSLGLYGYGNGLAFNSLGTLFVVNKEDEGINRIFSLDIEDGSIIQSNDVTSDFSIGNSQALAFNPDSGIDYLFDSSGAFFSIDESTGETTYISNNLNNLDGLTYISLAGNLSPGVSHADTPEAQFRGSTITVAPMLFDDFDDADELTTSYQITDASCTSGYNDNDIVNANATSVSFTGDISGSCAIEITTTDSDGTSDSHAVSFNTGSWSTNFTNMPTTRQALTSSVVNGKIYVIGGNRGSGAYYLSTVEAYDPATDTWATKTGLPTARNQLTSGVVNDIIYVIGGKTGAGFSTAVEAYDPSTDTWATKTSMPTARDQLTSGVVNGIIYVIGGSNGTDLSTVEAYDPSTDTWTTKTSMTTPTRGLVNSVVSNKIYVTGGYNVDGYSPTMEVYDPSTDTWTAKTDMPTARYTPTSSVVNNKVYVIGGENAAKLSTVEAYDPSTDTWITKTDMPTTRYDLTSSVVNGKIHVIGGGLGGSGYLSTVEAYDPSLD